MRLRSWVILALAAGAAFTVGFSYDGKAWPFFGRQPNYGYFHNGLDTQGTYVFPNTSTTAGCAASGGNAVPTTIDTADELIAFVECKLDSTNASGTIRSQEKIGAAFLIQTMIGTATNPVPTAAQKQQWEDAVRTAEYNGWITWNYAFSFNYNSYYQGANGGGADPIDDAFYGDNASATSIIFKDSTGAIQYGIKRLCANPVGNAAFSPLQQPWSITGTTTVTDSAANAGDTPTAITTTPGDTLNFVHKLTNNGPNSSASVSYRFFAYEDPTSSYTAQYYNNTALSGSPTITRQESDLYYNWGNGGPGGGVPNDNFSARWTKTASFNAGTYTFQSITDDGVRLYVDGALVINDWNGHPPTKNTANRVMTAGNHTIIWEYFESVGGATFIAGYYQITQGLTSAGTFTNGQSKNYTENVVVPLNAAVGSRVCRLVFWDPENSWGDRNTFGPMACGTVGADYDLDPTVIANQSNVQDGDTVTFTYRIANNGGSNSPAAQCYNKDGSGNMVGTVFTCSVSQVFTANSPPLTVGTENITIAGQPAGTTICRQLFIQPATSGIASRASNLTCVVVAKTPYVRIGGNDVWAGGGFAANNPACNYSAKITTIGRALGGTTPTQYAGSSVEYNAFALNKITGFGSAGSALVDSGILGSLPRSLTFANNEADATKLGYYGAASHCLTDYASRYISATPLAGGTYDVSTMGSGVWRVASGNLTLHGTMPAGATQIYLGDNTVTIDGDLKYPASYANISALPSLVVITSANINVLAGVRQLDGYYIAQGDGTTTGMFRDCWPKTSPQAVGDACDVNQLIVNGSVSAAYLELWRSYGASGATVAARKTPAELFNFTPEIYLRSALSNTSSPLVQVVNTIELPPRF